MTLIDLTWVNFKALVTDKSRIRYIEKETFYNVYYTDEGGEFVASIQKNAGADQVDFETNFKSLANKPKLMPIDSDGSPLQRTKITTSGWSYQIHGLEYKTGTLNSVYSKKVDGTDYGFSTLTCFKDNGVGVLVECVDQADVTLNCIMTQLDWMPTFDYEIIGGIFKQSSLPSQDVRLWIVGVPDVPAAYGGSKIFASSINMRFIGLEEGIKVDGRAPKYLTYSAVNKTNKMRMIIKHPAGFVHSIHVVFEIFKV